MGNEDTKYLSQLKSYFKDGNRNYIKSNQKSFQ